MRFSFTCLIVETVKPPDTASAANPRYGGGPTYYLGGGFLYRAPQPSQPPSGATSRPSNRDMRGTSYMGGRGMMRGGGRMNGMRGRPSAQS